MDQYDRDFYSDILPAIRKEVQAAYSRELGKLFDCSRLYDPAESEALKEEEVDW